jgi:ABC-type transport system involved in multi-copper enzyme maturation permease subunit
VSLILHHALKDLRAQRWLLALWAAVLAATCLIEAFKLDVAFSGPAALPMPWTVQSKAPTVPVVYVLFALALARVVLTWVLAIRFVHADPAEGTNAFWFTRPLSRHALLAAKALLIVGLLLLLPGLAAVSVFVMNGVPWTALPAAALQWMLLDALFLLPLTLLATLTRDLARMVLSVLVAAGGWALSQIYGQYWHLMPLENVYLRTTDRPVMTGVAVLVLAGVTVVVASALAGQQYLTRRTARTAIASVAGLFVILGITAAWPVRAALERIPRSVVEWPGGANVAAAVPGESIRVRAVFYHRPTGGIDHAYYVTGDLSIGGLDRDTVVHVIHGAAQLEAPGAEKALADPNVYAYGFGYLAGDLADRFTQGNFERAIGARLVAQQSRFGPWLQLLRVGSSKAYGEFEGKPGTYQATLTLEALGIGRVASMRLRPGESVELNGVETTIVAIRQSSTSPAAGRSLYSIDLRRATPRSWLARPADRVEIALRNRRRGEAVIAWNGGGYAAESLSHTFVVASRGRAQFDRSVTSVDIDDAWLADAELVMVSIRSLGEFEKTIRIENFVLPKVEVSETDGQQSSNATRK